ncbi:CHASE2 domain-containing protein [Kamptonema sp. UHCC 0994]|uniref:CHASE2 domain-containing protein n=1 Tax=Kamptonema sp. UHCC 0994 TaxID=3031329 RepID=UPI0023B9D9AB|nr:CHASE2 domain-containing protein [Kamptonema sp. UHCC 0994]MDF0551966.1 CHASE2 domain-containing protein [Kamptonema sp. UHCC 0994]
MGESKNGAPMIAKFSQKISSALPKLSNLHKPALNFVKSVAVASVAVTVLLVGARQIGMLEPLELAAFDQMLRWRKDEGPDPRLLIVRITEGDIQRLKEWPISDRKVTHLLQNLERLEPRVIGLDLLRDVPLGDGRAELTKVLQKNKRIVGVCLLSDGTPEQPGSPPAPGLANNQVGFADLVVDSGGVLRRTAFFIKPPEPPGVVDKHLCNNSSVPFLSSFGFQIVHLYLEQQGIKLGTSPQGKLMLGSTVISPLEKDSGGYKNANVGGYQLLINYRSARNVAQFADFADVLEGKIDPKLVKDRIVLIGYATDTVKDAFYTPYSAGKQNHQSMPGIVAHAQIVSQVLSAVLDRRPLFWFWPEWGEILWIWGWSMAGAVLAWGVQQPARFGLAGGAMLGVCLGVGFGLFILGGWVPVVTPAIALMATAGSVVLGDRFNKGGYGKVITDKVKQVFKIEIDQSKKEQQVAEIIESEFFRDLQQKKSELKTRKKEVSETGVSQTQEPETTENEAEDYFAQLQQKAKQKRRKASDVSEESASSEAIAQPESNNPTADNPPDEGFADLAAKAKQMKRRRTQLEAENSNLTEENPPDEGFADLAAKAKQMKRRRSAEKIEEVATEKKDKESDVID